MYSTGTIRKIFSKIFTPKVSDEDLKKYSEKFREQFPPPVIWFLGKAQSGKTSIIRSLTGAMDAEIGNGFEPCTKSSKKYAFPNKETPLAQFIDTRGIGESSYEPEEDIERFKNMANILVVTVTATDHSLNELVQIVKKIKKTKPEWPVIVAQTCLHHAYPDPSSDHVYPYPYDQDPLPQSVPTDLMRSLAKQRDSFSLKKASYIPVDITKPEDGYSDPDYGVPQPDYGVPQLRKAISDALPEARRNAFECLGGFKSFKDPYFMAAHPHIMSYSMAAGVVGLSPIPFSDIFPILAIQVKMIQALASIYNQKFEPSRAFEFLSAIGLGFVLRYAYRQLIKMIPWFGQTAGAIAAGVYTAAMTYGLGIAVCFYYAEVLKGNRPPSSAVNAKYREGFSEGMKIFKEKIKEFLSKFKGKSKEK